MRVKAVLLHETRKSKAYIILRIRWLSDCFHVYLRNSRTICDQHNASLMSVNEIIVKAITMAVGSDIPLGDLRCAAIPEDPVYTLGCTCRSQKWKTAISGQDISARSAMRLKGGRPIIVVRAPTVINW